MVLNLDRLWDDVVGGPSHDKGLGKLRKLLSIKPPPAIKEDDDDVGESSGSKVYQRSSVSMPLTPTTPVTPSTSMSSAKANVWRSVFHPGSNINTKHLGAKLFDSPQPNSLQLSMTGSTVGRQRATIARN